MASEKNIEQMEPEEVKKKGCQMDVCQPDYPRRVFFIIGNEFCERFCYYGMKAVLQSYLILKLGQSPDTAGSLYHAFAIVTYFMPLPGAILADSFLGRYWTIFSLSIVYVIGNIIMATTTLDGGSLVGAIIGMFTIAVGTGGIKPCVSSFGADQFTSKQTDMQKSFFSMFYISINAGALISQFVTPIIKSTPCFGEPNCWVLAFGIPAGLMVVALVFFLVGTPYYTRAPVTENVALKMAVAVGKGIARSCSSDKRKVDHWLDRAVPDFSQQFVDDCKAVFRVLVLFIPLPFFWALFDQTGSRWTLQAQKMNSYIDFLDVHMEAEQIQIMNGLMVVIFVAIFDAAVYPLFAKCNLLVKPLQRIVAGCGMAALSFIVIGFIQLSVQGTNDPLSLHDTATFRTRVYNIHPVCTFALPDTENGGEEPVVLEKYDTMLLGPGYSMDGTYVNFTDITCGTEKHQDVHYQIRLDHGKPISAIFFQGPSLAEIHISYGDGSYPLNEQKEPLEEYLFHILVSYYTPLLSSDIKSMTLVKGEGSFGGSFDPSKTNSFPGNMSYNVGQVPSQYYKVRVTFPNDTVKDLDTNVYLLQGGIYTVYLFKDEKNEYVVKLLCQKNPHQVSVFLQAIPYLIITWGEILFSITGLSFAFSQAPVSMKAILTAGWLLTASFGNVIDLIIIEIKIPDKAIEFFLFAGLMVVVTIIVAIMSYFYVYVEDIEKKEDKKDPEHTHHHAQHFTPLPTVPSMPYLGVPPPDEEEVEKAQKQQVASIYAGAPQDQYYFAGQQNAVTVLPNQVTAQFVVDADGPVASF